MRAAEQFVLTVTELGYGKRSSSYDFRRTGRGGKGIRATDVSKVGEIGRLVAVFPVGDGDQIMLVTDGGKGDPRPGRRIRFAGRATKGVTIFRTAEGEKVSSVEHIPSRKGWRPTRMSPAVKPLRPMARFPTWRRRRKADRLNPSGACG